VLRVTTLPGVVLKDPPLELVCEGVAFVACGAKTRDGGTYASSQIDFLVPTGFVARKFDLRSEKGDYAIGKPDDAKDVAARDDRDVLLAAVVALQDQVGDAYREIAALQKQVRRERNDSIDAWHELKVAREAFDQSLLTQREEIARLEERLRRGDD
jgi:hypothetical protein